MGSLFQHGRVRLNIGGPKYHRLEETDPWVGLDDDEDEYINPRSPSSTNPAYRDKQDGHFEELTIDVENEDDEFLIDRRMLERQGSPLYKTLVAKQEASCRHNKRPLFCAVTAVFICISVVCLIYFSLPNTLPPSEVSSMERSSDFAMNVTGATETSIRLFDVNNDGVEDIIFGYSRLLEKVNEDGMKSFCDSLNMSEPCAGAVTALDGRDGTVLWEFNVECEVFSVQCGKLDVNGDGQDDCIIAGRLGLLHAVDTTNGAHLWSADPAVTNISWNYYQPQIIPDLNGDNVPDLVTSHGGNGDYNADETDRDANRFVLLSGKTGKSLGGKYLETPDHTETYSSVSLYEKDNGAIYVLFGTGGETVKGSLWMISLLDLYCHIMDYDHECEPDTNIPVLQRKKYGPWGSPLTVTPEGAKEIIRCDINKGVMVPTVLADMNQDGTMDLIVSIFNGTVAVLDGQDLSIIWTTGDQFQEFETYSTPAPGFFNSDDIPDLMIRLSHGNWSAHYNYTLVFIVDGRDGQMLWSTQSHSKEPVMSSPLTIRGQRNKDAFLFWMQGRNNDADDTELTMQHPPPPVTPQPRDGKNDKRLPRHDDKGLPIDCDELTKQFESELLIMNRDLTQNPLRVALNEPYKFYFNTDHSLFGPDDAPLRKKRHHDASMNSSKAGETPQHIPPLTTKGQTSTKVTLTPASSVIQETLSKPSPQSSLTMATQSLAEITTITPVPDRTFAPEDFVTSQNIDKEPPAVISQVVTGSSSIVTETTLATTNVKTSKTQQRVSPTVLDIKPFDGYPLDSIISTDYGSSQNHKPSQTAPPYDRENKPYQYSASFNDNVDNVDYDYEGDDIFGHNQGHQLTDEEDTDVPDDFQEPVEGEHHHPNESDIPCVLVSSWLRATGTIGDLDKDGILDIIYIINFLSPNPNMEDGHVGIKSVYSTLVKTSLQNAHQDFITLDHKKTACHDASIRCNKIDFSKGYDWKLDLKGSKWTGYCGRDGNCQYE